MFFLVVVFREQRRSTRVTRDYDVGKWLYFHCLRGAGFLVTFAENYYYRLRFMTVTVLLKIIYDRGFELLYGYILC